MFNAREWRPRPAGLVAVRTGVKDLLRRTKVRKEDIRAVGVTGDDYGLVCLDEEGSTLNLVHLGPQADLEEYSEGFTSAIAPVI